MEDTNPDLVQVNPGQSDAFDRWTKIEVEQGDDLLQELRDLSLVEIFLFQNHCWVGDPEKNGRLHATPEASLRLVVSLCDWWAVA